MIKVLVTFSSATLMSATAAVESVAGPATDYRLLENALRFAVDESFFMDAFFIYRSATELRSAAGGAEAVHELAETVRGRLREQYGRRPLPTDPGRLLWTLTFEDRNLFPSKQQKDAALREAEAVLREVEEGLPVEAGVLGFAYHALGAAAGNAGRLDESESWYRKAIEVAEEDYAKFMTYRNLVDGL